MGKFVVKKALKDLGIEGDSIPPDKVKQFTEMVVMRAIYDAKYQEQARGDIKSLLAPKT